MGDPDYDSIPKIISFTPRNAAQQERREKAMSDFNLRKGIYAPLLPISVQPPRLLDLIRSSKAGIRFGNDNLSIDHLKQLLRASHKDGILSVAQHDFLRAYTAFVNIVYIQQTAPAGFFAAGMSGELIPLPKDNQASPILPPRIRPIVIANLGRKLADKHVKALDAKGQEELFRNSNYAVGAKCGSDIFFHLQQVLSENHPDWITSQHDFANAFNNACRNVMVDQYTLLRPDIAMHRRNALAAQPHLCVVTPHGPTTVQSQSGTQQGGPLSSLDHAMSIRPLIAELQSHTEETGNINININIALLLTPPTPSLSPPPKMNNSLCFVLLRSYVLTRSN